MYYCQNQNHDNLNKTEPAVLIESSHVHGCSNGNFNKWEKVKVGKQVFLQKYEQAEKDVKEVGTDQAKLEQFMTEFSDELHTMMLNDRFNDFSDVESGYPWHFEKHGSSIFARNTFNFATVSTQVLVIHKSGLAMISESIYRH